MVFLVRRFLLRELFGLPALQVRKVGVKSDGPLNACLLLANGDGLSASVRTRIQSGPLGNTLLDTIQIVVVSGTFVHSALLRSRDRVETPLLASRGASPEGRRDLGDRRRPVRGQQRLLSGCDAYNALMREASHLVDSTVSPKSARLCKYLKQLELYLCSSRITTSPADSRAPWPCVVTCSDKSPHQTPNTQHIP